MCQNGSFWDLPNSWNWFHGKIWTTEISCFHTVQLQRYYHPYHRHHLLLNYRKCCLPHPRSSIRASSGLRKPNKVKAGQLLCSSINWRWLEPHILFEIYGYFHFPAIGFWIYFSISYQNTLILMKTAFVYFDFGFRRVIMFFDTKNDQILTDNAYFM